MRNISFAFVLSFLTFSNLWAQCQTYFPMRNGAVLEYAMYDGRNQETGRMTYRVTAVNRAGTEATVQSNFVGNARGSRPVTSTFTVKCNNGAMNMLIRGAGASGNLNVNMQGSAVYVEYPARMTVGQRLPDGVADVTGTATATDTRNTSMTVNGDFRIYNRKVLAIERVTSTAGTWEAYKIGSESEMGMGVQGVNMGKMRSNSTEWFVKNVGMVRSESEIVGGGMGRVLRAAGGSKSSMVLVSIR